MGSFFFRELQLISCVNVPKHLFRSSRPEVLCRKGVFRNFAIKETLAQMFSCEFCEISKNTCFYRTPPVAASELSYESKHWASCSVSLTGILLFRFRFLFPAID